MGLIKAALDATVSTMSDVWKDYFVCDALDNDILMVKGVKKASKRSLFGNNDNNVITDGSGIVVANGQCAIIVDDGEVREVAGEPGLYTFDTSKGPSFFGQGFLNGVKNAFNEVVERFTYGGDAASDHRIYYVNIKEIVGNKYGTASPVPFRVIDKNIGLDVDISVRMNGEYSFRIENPLIFYTNVAGNVASYYSKSELESQMRSEFLTALQPSLAIISSRGVRYSEVPMHVSELSDALNEELSDKWFNLRGIKVVSLAVNSINASKEDEDMIKQLQKSAVMRDPNMAAATLVGAQADAMRMAASNTNGAMQGFMGMNMANQAGGMNINSLYEMGNKEVKTDTNAGGWMCECGAANTGNFCTNCGKPRPTSKFCSKCGKEVKADDKFCPACGNQLS